MLEAGQRRKATVRQLRRDMRERFPKATGNGPEQLDVRRPEGQTDLANARRFVKLHGDNVRYCHPWKKWLIWDDTRWAVDDSGAVIRFAKAVADAVWQAARQSDEQTALRFAARTASDKSIRAMLALAAPDVPVLPAEMDTDGWLLNCPNGTVDLKTGELREHRREDMITQLCPTQFNPDAGSYVWDRTIETVLAHDSTLIEFLQRWCGHCLTGDVREHYLPIFFGSGANGKSTLIEAFMFALGADYAMKAPPDLLLAKRNDAHPTERADLFGKRFVACVETADGRRLNESLVKELTGGDTIRARRMREDFWQFQPTHKVIVCTNHKPTVRGTDHGIWRRLCLVPFAVTFAEHEQDKSLPGKLRGQAEGILAWAVRGCRDWQRQGLMLPDAVTTATSEYRAAEDVQQRFIEEECVILPDARQRASDLYACYKTWCEHCGERAESQHRFGKTLATKGYHKQRSNGIWWQGIGLQEK